MSDEGFREIQLNGKQLVFLFMAATVVLVVTFLLGVLTGRSVPTASGAAEMEVADVRPDPEAMTVPDNPAPLSSTAPVPPPAAEAAPPAEELSYAERLLREETPAETLKQTPPAKTPPPAAPAPAVQEPVATPSAPPPAVQAPAPVQTPPAVVQVPPAAAAPAPLSTSADPSGPGFAVQVAAYRDRREADTLAKQLIAKGYPAFVMDPVKGAPTAMFRVRVGKYKTLKDAEAASTRLQTAEQFKPWIAR